MKHILLFLIIVTSNAIYAFEKLPDLKIDQINENVYLYKSYQNVAKFGLVSSNGLVLVANRKAFLIDTPWSSQDTKILLNWIKEKGFDLVGSISTHSHEDRTAGIKLLNSLSIPTYASTLTNDLLNNKNKELALNTFGNSEALLFDGRIEVLYSGGGHTVDNVVVWLPRPKILFGGCLVRSLEAISLGYTGEAVIDNWSNSIEKILAKYPNVSLVVPGHGKVGDTRLLEHTKILAESASKKSTQRTVSDSAD